MKTPAAYFLTGLLLAAAFVLGGCASRHMPPQGDPVPLGSVGFEAARIAAETGLLF